MLQSPNIDVEQFIFELMKVIEPIYKVFANELQNLSEWVHLPFDEALNEAEFIVRLAEEDKSGRPKIYSTVKDEQLRRPKGKSYSYIGRSRCSWRRYLKDSGKCWCIFSFHLHRERRNHGCFPLSVGHE